MRFSTLYQSLNSEERDALAKAVDCTDAGYLWQIATRWRGKKPSFGFMQKLVAAEPRLTLGELAEEFSEDVAADDTQDDPKGHDKPEAKAKAVASDGKGGKAKPAPPMRSSKPKAIPGALPVVEHAKA